MRYPPVAAQGKRPGRPRKLGPARLAAARTALREEQPVEQVAAAFGGSRLTLSRYLAQDA
ncbi:helix-turn-helix domain-containing protein [Nocardia grenadensis]|uniref:helix-turn-helix domain-containing protein n=1 Tax=Nocardia grenadensis TaxID=931537 RepID=UPI003D745A31